MGNREPNRDDVLVAIASNKTVNPETMHDVEVGYKFIHSKYPFAVNFYFMQYKDQLVLTGKLNDVGNPIKENVPQSYRAGLELSASTNIYKGGRKMFAINDNLSLSLNKIKSFDEYIYTYDDNYSPVDSLTQIVTHKNSNISFSPSIVASLELVAYPVNSLEISLMNKAVSKQYLDNTSNED